MTQFKEYKLVMGDNGKTFVEDINKLIADGWQPIGGVSILSGLPPETAEPEIQAATNADSKVRFFTFQAMVR
ncbi:MAG: DUF1737 domain-containing protein [Chitinophagaceae bacterium]